MRATAPLLVATHERCAAHEPPPGHPDRPERLRAALTGAAAAGAEPLLVPLVEKDVLAGIVRVHDPRMPERLRRACEHPPAIFDSEDNPVSRGTYGAALAAAGAAIAAAGAAAEGSAGAIWVPVRPPGHHALRDRAMGFCFFNNAAIAAEELLARGCGPVAIVDFDVHHGNGTQDIFWHEPRVLYASTHQWPLYPGTGARAETGVGNIVNAQLPAGAGSTEFRTAVQETVLPRLHGFRPQLVMISSGFDAHRLDPLASLNLEADDYAWVTRELVGVAREHAQGRVVSGLEGGYSLSALRDCTVAHVAALME